MNPIARFEHFVERLMERTMLRATNSKLQPVEIAKRLARVMEGDQVVGPMGVRVPNIFDVELSGADFAQFKPIQSSVLAEIEAYLSKVARERMYLMASTPIVRLHTSSDFRAGEFGVHAQMEDIQPAGNGRPAVDGSPIPQYTAAMPQVVAAPSALAPRRHVSRLLGSNHSFELDSSFVTVGRASDNGVVIDDRRVSRKHAQLTESQGRWTVQDLGSTNGTAVNGAITKQAQLRDGDRISLGGFELVFQE